jgi:hypothetical protein
MQIDAGWRGYNVLGESFMMADRRIEEKRGESNTQGGGKRGKEKGAL